MAPLRRVSRGGIDRVVALLAAVALAATGVACAGSSRSAGSTTTTAVTRLVACGQKRTFVYASVPGVEPNRTSLDVYAPPAGQDDCSHRALVVWVHGGGWTDGDKSEYMPDKVALFNGAGWVFASVNYRLTDLALAPPAPQWPVHDQDVADALAWLVHHADALGVDPSRIAVLGHSAGGGIVAAISTDDRYLGANDLPLDTIRCTAGLDGEGYDVTAGATTYPTALAKGYKEIFGSDPARWAEASPVRHVAPGKGIPAFFLAIRGESWRLAPQVAFADALRRAGISTTVLDVAAMEHIDLTTAVGAPGDKLLTPPLMAFLDHCFAASKG